MNNFVEWETILNKIIYGGHKLTLFCYFIIFFFLLFLRNKLNKII